MASGTAAPSGSRTGAQRPALASTIRTGSAPGPTGHRAILRRKARRADAQGTLARAAERCRIAPGRRCARSAGCRRRTGRSAALPEHDLGVLHSLPLSSTTRPDTWMWEPFAGRPAFPEILGSDPERVRRGVGFLEVGGRLKSRCASSNQNPLKSRAPGAGPAAFTVGHRRVERSLGKPTGRSLRSDRSAR